VKYFLLSLLATLVNCFTAHLSKADTINISSDIWCPYICDESPGYVVEMTTRAFALMGHEVKFKLLPFNRALLEVNKGTIDAVLAVTSKNLIDHQLHSGGIVIGQSYNDFYTLTSNNWTFTDLSSLQRNTVAIIGGYDYDAFQPYIDAHPELFYTATGESPLAMNLKRLVRKRFRIILDNRNVVNYNAKQLHLTSQIRYAGSYGDNLSLFVGFSTAHRQYASIFAAGIDKLKARGEFQNILAKYQIHPFE
jgi:polar amino acid transport system substrate-binding protein